MIISVECFGKTVQQAHDRLRAMMDATPSDYEKTHEKMGFGFTNKTSSAPGDGCDNGGGGYGG